MEWSGILLSLSSLTPLHAILLFNDPFCYSNLRTESPTHKVSIFTEIQSYLWLKNLYYSYYLAQINTFLNESEISQNKSSHPEVPPFHA